MLVALIIPILVTRLDELSPKIHGKYFPKLSNTWNLPPDTQAYEEDKRMHETFGGGGEARHLVCAL